MLKVCIIGLLLKLALDLMVCKVLLIRCTRGLVKSVGATCHIITESATCKKGSLRLGCHREKVWWSLILSVSIVCSWWYIGCLILTKEARCHSLRHVIIWECWRLDLCWVIISTKLRPARCSITVILLLTSCCLLEAICEVHWNLCIKGL